jgi:hypothetical protein
MRVRIAGRCWSCLFPVGLVMLVRAANGRRAERRNAWLRAWPLTQTGPQLQVAGQPAVKVAPYRVYSVAATPRRRKTRAMRPAFTKPAWVGLVMLLCYLVIDIPVWLVCVVGRAVPRGLPVRLMSRAVTYEPAPGIQPLLVRLAIGGCDPPHAYELGGPRPCLRIDTLNVSWDDFDSVLQDKLLLRPTDWPVFLEGDRAMNWKYAAEVIDRIEGLHGKVVLLGSRTP